VIVYAEQAIWDEEVSLPLFHFLSLFRDRRHILLTPGVTKTSIDAWLRRVPSNIASETRTILSESLREFPNRNRRPLAGGRAAGQFSVVPSSRQNWQDGKLSLLNAIDVLSRPLHVVVENRRNDGAFVRRMMLPSERRTLEKAIEKGWLTFEMGGGIDELKFRLEEVLEPQSRHAWVCRLTTCFICDRDTDPQDRKMPSEIVREIEETAKKMLAPWPVGIHRLRRRSIENYVPKLSLHRFWTNDHNDRVQKVEALYQLTNDARHLFNMKKGFAGDRKDRRQDSLDNHNIDAIFHNTDPVVRAALRHGFKKPSPAEAYSTSGAIDEAWFSLETPDDERMHLAHMIVERI
jgi:hypothetical protein